jgi:hypothetical protein
MFKVVWVICLHVYNPIPFNKEIVGFKAYCRHENSICTLIEAKVVDKVHLAEDLFDNAVFECFEDFEVDDWGDVVLGVFCKHLDHIRMAIQILKLDIILMFIFPIVLILFFPLFEIVMRLLFT